MIKAYSIIIRKKFFSFYNSLIFYLQKVPIVKKLIKDRLFRINKYEKAIGVLSIIYTILRAIIGKFAFFMFISSVIGTYLVPISKLDPAQTNLYILVAFTLVGTMAYFPYFFENNLEVYTHIKLIGIKPKDYYLSMLYSYGPLYVLSSSFIYYFFFNWTKLEFLNVAGFFALSLCVRVFFSAIFVYIFGITKKIYYKAMTTLSVAIILLGLATGSLKIFLLADLNLDWMFGKYNYLIFLVVYELLRRYLSKVDTIDEIAYSALNLNELRAVITENVSVNQVKIQDNDIDLTCNRKDYSEYEGIEYINRIFFDRTISLFKKKIIRKLLITGVIYIGILLALYFTGANKLIAAEIKSGKNISSIFSLVGFFIGFFIYFGDHFIKYCFYNMDLKLLKYDFYREKKNLLLAIKIRVLTLIKYNLPQLLSTLLFFVLGMLMIGSPYIDIVLACISVVCGMLFFSLHYLFAYYLLQPFADNMVMKNPIYSMVPIIMYSLVGRVLLSLMSEGNSLLILTGLLIFAIVYVLLGIVLVSRFANKTFRLR